MTYVRKLVQMSSTTTWDRYEVYEQPRVDHMRYLAFKAFWYASWKFKPLSWFIDNVLDAVITWQHRKTCAGDCTTMTVVLTGEKRKVCARMPLDARLDCLLYDFDRKNSTTLASTVVERP